VLALNTLYFNKKNDITNQGSVPADHLTWIRLQLSENSNRKFILTSHIYPGAKYESKSKNLFMPDFNNEYFDLLLEFKDKIVIEVAAHDHYSDLRYHSNGDS
jgi:hypothetical protein